MFSKTKVNGKKDRKIKNRTKNNPLFRFMSSSEELNTNMARYTLIV
ncbi:hypothetical protein ACSAZK_07925 [Methanosarcina sp. Mfa9]